MPCPYCVPLRKLQWLLHCVLHQRRCWSWAGQWWWWLELHVVAVSCSDLCWCWSWPSHLAPWSLHLVLVVVVTGSHLRWWCFSLRHWHKDSTCTRSGFTHCNLHWWCFSFHPLVQILDLHLGNLHCVVVVFGGNDVTKYGRLKWSGHMHICGGLCHPAANPA